MQLRTGRTTILGLGMALLLAACGEAPADDATANGADTSVADNVPPPLPDDATVPPVDASAAAPVAATPCPVDAQCFSSLVLTPAPMTLMRDERVLTVRGNLTIANRDANPIAIALLRSPVVMNLNNGSQMEVALNREEAYGGINLCKRDGARCFEETPDRFRQITANDSAAQVNLTFRSYVVPGQIATLPDITSGTMTMRLYLVPAGETGRTVDVSIPVRIENQIR